jgi:hypothetical protein
MRLHTGLILILLVLFLTSCQTAGQIDAETRRYVAMSQADTKAQAAQVEINATATAVQHQANIDAGVEDEQIAAGIDYVWWKSVVINTGMVAGCLAYIAWLYYSVRFAGAKTREAKAKATEAEARAAKYVAFPLDAKTGAYPAIGIGDMLLLPNQGSNMSTITPHEPNEYMIAGATYIQAARLIAENAAKAAKEGDGAGVAMTNPALLDVGLDTSLLLGSSNSELNKR